MISRILCMFRGHAWRRARKAEDAKKKFCKRCPASVDVAKRAPRVPRPV